MICVPCLLCPSCLSTSKLSLPFILFHLFFISFGCSSPRSTLLVFKILWFVSLQTLMSSWGKIRAGIISKHQHRLPSSSRSLLPPSLPSFPPSPDLIPLFRSCFPTCLFDFLSSFTHLAVLFLSISYLWLAVLFPSAQTHRHLFLLRCLFLLGFLLLLPHNFSSISLLNTVLAQIRHFQSSVCNYCGITGVVLLSMGSFQLCLSVSLNIFGWMQQVHEAKEENMFA